MSKKKKKREQSNVTKVRSNVILVLPNAMMELSNVKKLNKGKTKCGKSTVIYNVGTA